MSETPDPTALVQRLRPRTWRLLTERASSGVWTASCRGATGGAVCEAPTEDEALGCLAEILAMRRLPGALKRLGWIVEGPDDWETLILRVRSPDGVCLAIGFGARLASGNQAAKALGRPDQETGTTAVVLLPAHVLDRSHLQKALADAMP